MEQYMWSMQPDQIISDLQTLLQSWLKMSTSEFDRKSIKFNSVLVRGNGGSVYVTVGNQRWRLNRDGTRTLQPDDGHTLLPASTKPGTSVEFGPGTSFIDASNVPACPHDESPSVVIKGPSSQSGQGTMKGSKHGGTLYYVEEANLNGTVTIDDTEHPSASYSYSSLVMPQSWTTDNTELIVSADNNLTIQLKANTVRGSHPEDGADKVVVKGAVDNQAHPPRVAAGAAKMLFWFNRDGHPTPYELVIDPSGKASFKEKVVVDYSAVLEELI